MCQMAENAEGTGYFQKVYPMTEILERDGMKASACYIRDGQLDYVYTHENVGYFRKTSKIIIQSDIGGATTACNDGEFLSMIIPLRFVGIVDKGKLDDDAFSDDRLALSLINALQGAVSVDVNAKSVDCQITGYETDDYRVWDDEIQGADYGLRKDLSFIAVDMDIQVYAHRDCLLDECYG